MWMVQLSASARIFCSVLYIPWLYPDLTIQPFVTKLQMKAWKSQCHTKTANTIRWEQLLLGSMLNSKLHKHNVHASYS
jgi:hypothetical protein